jgi:hypothetical protein
MSYALTDAGESDLKKELRVLDTLVQDIDQLASEARDCDTVSPKLKSALDVAWWIAENDLRKSGSSSCGHVDLFVCKSYTPGKEFLETPDA